MPKIIKKCILKRQLAYAIMAVAKKEIIKSKQHTPGSIPLGVEGEARALLERVEKQM